MSREADGFLDCVCMTCGWTRRLVADNQGHAGPILVMMHGRHCCARLTDEELEEGRMTFAEELALEGACNQPCATPRLPYPRLRDRAATRYCFRRWQSS
jgi:hypothetical protein